MSTNFNDLMYKLGYRFDNEQTLEQAITRSNPHSDSTERRNYERLELLGGTVLQMVITEYLFKTMHEATEGALNIQRSDLMCLETQNGIADDLQLNKYIKNPSVAATSGSRYDKYVEAIIGAVHADAGFGQRGLGKAKSVIFRLWKIKEPPKTNKCKIM